MHALLLFVLLLARGALAGELLPPTSEQKLVYDLTIDDKAVGRRVVTVRYVPPDDVLPEETRIIESWEEVDARVKGVDVKMRTRITARSSESASSYVASQDLNGKVQEVQGRRGTDGKWTVTILGDGKVSTWEYRRSEVDLTTMDLLDPERPAALHDNATARVLVAEAGIIMDGLVRDLDEAKLKVAGQQVPVHRWDWAPSAGRVELSWSLDGLLVGYEAAFMGATLRARVQKVPEPRTFGEIELSPTTSAGTKVFEEDL